MADLSFPIFRRLIRDIDKRQLFDAVKPVLQDYADENFGDKRRGDAYQWDQQPIEPIMQAVDIHSDPATDESETSRGEPAGSLNNLTN